MCRKYETRSAKGFLPLISGRSRTIKRSVASMALVSVLHKPCKHQTEQSFKKTCHKYENQDIQQVSWYSCMRTSAKKTLENENADETQRKFAVLPLHRIAHKLKNIAAENDIKVCLEKAWNKRLAYYLELQKKTNFGESHDAIRYHRPSRDQKRLTSSTGCFRKLPILPFQDESDDAV